MNDNNINNLIDEWLDFREEYLSILNNDDKKHSIYFDEHTEKILNNVPKINQKFVKQQLYELDNEFVDYTNYWNRKYYKNGFKDAFNLIHFTFQK